MKHDEYQLQKQVCIYLEHQYPDVLFLSDTVANCKLTMQQAVRNKAIQKSGFKCPDFIILEPSNGFAGLMIELKIKSPFKKNGEILSDEHLKGQLKSLELLQKKRYMTQFCWTFEMAKDLIDRYLK
jgi:hypothetical protein